jgi:hypothetical protein
VTKEEYLQNEILKNYRSVMAFAKDIGIPYTTIKGVLSRGVDGASVQTVIKVCDALGVDIYYLFRENFNNTEKKSASELSDTDNVDYDDLGMQIYQSLLKRGLVKEGQDLTDAQIRFLDGLTAIISAYFDGVAK